MDLDTIFYIIAVIVIFIVSLFGQNKKKKDIPVQSDADEVVYSLNDFEKILQRKEQFRQAVENVESQDLEEFRDDSLHDELELKKQFEREEDLRKKEELEKEKNDKKIVSEKNEDQDGFDLNSAIIYSSILERKKFRH